MVTDITPSTVRNEWLFLHSLDRCTLDLLDSHKMTVERGARQLS
jgi:hypothetical protein